MWRGRLVLIHLIALCGLLAGLKTVDAVMSNSILRNYVERLMDQELVPALSVPTGFDVSSYRDQLLQRFDNPCLAHRCAQIAMDSSEKIWQRWLPVLQQGSAPLLLKARVPSLPQRIPLKFIMRVH